MSENVMVRAVYKCPLCGRLQSPSPAQEVPRDLLPGLCGKVIQNQTFAGNPWLHQVPIQIPCRCPDGSCGMAWFAGFKRV